MGIVNDWLTFTSRRCAIQALDDRSLHPNTKLSYWRTNNDTCVLFVFLESSRKHGRGGPFSGGRRRHEDERGARRRRLHEEEERVARLLREAVQVGVPSADRRPHPGRVGQGAPGAGSNHHRSRSQTSKIHNFNSHPSTNNVHSRTTLTVRNRRCRKPYQPPPPFRCKAATYHPSWAKARIPRPEIARPPANRRSARPANHHTPRTRRPVPSPKIGPAACTNSCTKRFRVVPAQARQPPLKFQPSAYRSNSVCPPPTTRSSPKSWTCAPP